MDPAISSFMLSDSNLKHNNMPNIHFVALDKISPHLTKAVLSAEDDMFFLHHGFNWEEMIKALRFNLKKKKLKRGASTITQQVARNLFLKPDKSLFRKLREFVLTYQLENKLTKKRILELYLNIAEFGPGIYGVAAASNYHFKLKPSQLTAAQAALLAAVLPKPKKYGKKPYPNITFSRQKDILYRLAHYDLHLPLDLK